MIWRLLRSDLKRSAVISATLAALVAVAAALVATSLALTTRTASAIDAFWEQSLPPDSVQMHAGPMDASAVTTWAAQKPEVVDHQVIKTLPVPGSAMWLRGESQAASVLEPALVLAPQRFDLLLDDHGRPVSPGPGEIAMPVHYLAEGTLAEGDTVVIKARHVERQFRVVAFARDAQMNPSLVTSKRMVVNPTDFAPFAAVLEPEYLVEFRLAPGSNARAFQDAYIAAGLPHQGIAVDSSIFRLMNGLSTYLVAVVALLVAVLLVGVAGLALRFAFLTAIDDDLPEIATLKAIGAPNRPLKSLFLAKYAVIAGVGALVGLALALWATPSLLRPVVLYVGEPEATALRVGAPVAGAMLTAILMIGFCWALLRRLDRLSATQALRGSRSPKTLRNRGGLSHTRLDPHSWLGLRAALRPGNLLLVAIVAISTFTMILPAAVSQTASDPRFATYLGVGPADIRVDVRQGAADLGEVASSVERDPDVTRHVVLTSTRLQMRSAAGEWESVLVESGDHSVFPLSYSEGGSPSAEREIALSINQAKAISASVGDTVRVKEADREVDLLVTGLYQDITNGGRTAKARFAPSSAPMWQVIYASVPGDRLDAVAQRWQQAHPGAKVTRIADYASQTMGATTNQLDTAGIVVALGSLVLTFLVVTLFATLVVSRSRHEVAVLRAIGATPGGIRRQLALQLALPALVGLVLAVIGIPTAGHALFGAVLGRLGAPGVVLLPDVAVSYVFLPLAMAAAIATAIALAFRRIPHNAALTQE